MTVTKPYTFTTGVILASEVNANFDELFDALNNDFMPIDGSQAFTNVPTGPSTNPTTDNHLTRKGYVDGMIAYKEIVPSGSSDTTTEGAAADWGGTTTIDVPTWATKAIVTATVIGPFGITEEGGTVSVRAAIGNAPTDVTRTHIPSLNRRVSPIVVCDEVTLVGTGSQSLRVQAQRTSGTGAWRIDANSRVTFVVVFKP